MKVSEVFVSTYLKAADLNNQTKRAVIDSVTIETMRDGAKKPVLWFKNAERGLVLNKTNADTLAESFGDDMDAWIGKRIELFAMRVQGPNGMVDGIRLRALIPPAPAKPEPATATVSDDRGPDFDDDIPF